MQSAIITRKSVAIMNFVMRSTPFCSPRLQTAKPMSTATSIQPMSSTGFASMLLNTAPVTEASALVKMPEAIFGM